MTGGTGSPVMGPTTELSAQPVRDRPATSQPARIVPVQARDPRACATTRARVRSARPTPMPRRLNKSRAEIARHASRAREGKPEATTPRDLACARRASGSDDSRGSRGEQAASEARAPIQLEGNIRAHSRRSPDEDPVGFLVAQKRQLARRTCTPRTTAAHATTPPRRAAEPSVALSDVQHEGGPDASGPPTRASSSGRSHSGVPRGPAQHYLCACVQPV